VIGQIGGSLADVVHASLMAADLDPAEAVGDRAERTL
jgi:hypothetical protein